MTMSFKEAYGVLNRHAQALRNQQEPNIDDLLGIVTESVEAYKVCKQRIDAVETALSQALADPVVASSASASDDSITASASVISEPTASKPKASGFDDMDDDIPF
jgi:exodeoxyribonuclease VII small subunit